MICNVGPKERAARNIAGVVLLLLGILATAWAPWLRWVLAIVGVALIVTGLSLYCPVNQLFGIQNCTASERLEHAVSKP